MCIYIHVFCTVKNNVSISASSLQSIGVNFHV